MGGDVKIGLTMPSVREELVVWEYLRWDGKYREWLQHPALRNPDFNNPEENRLRWDLLAGDRGLPGDFGQIQRIRFPFGQSLPPYLWVRERLPEDIFPNAFLNYMHNNQLLKLEEVASEFLATRNLPLPFNDQNASVVRSNLERLKKRSDTDDFNAIILCRPTPAIAPYAYRIVEGTKRAIAYRVAKREGVDLPEIYCYFGDYDEKKP